MQAGRRLVYLLLTLMLQTCFCQLSACAASADSWQKCVGNTTAPISDGFGFSLTQNVQSLESFNGYLYAGVGMGEGSNWISVWRSSDLVNWTNVGPALSNATEQLFMTRSDTAIFFGTENNIGGSTGQIWKSTNGTTWTMFNTAGEGWTNSGQNIDALANDGTMLYAATGLSPTTGGQFWRRPLDGSSNWVHLYDLPTGITATWLYPVTICGTNFLFMTTSAWPISAPAQAWLYVSRDGGSTWASNAAVGNGFGNTNNLNLAWLVVFNDYMYGGIHNINEGAQLWRVPLSNIDGPWTEVTQVHDGFGFGPPNSELHRATVAAGYLWVATLSAEGLGSQVWRSSNGVDFIQSNLSGFVSSNRTSKMGTITGFGTNVVWGGGSQTTGAQIWKTSFDRHFLSVVSTHGNPAPPAGTNWYDGGTVQTGSVTGSENVGTTQYVCTGWTVSGVATTSGTGTTATITLTNDAVLTWLWLTNHWLTVTISGAGTCDTTNSWIAAGSNVTITAAPATGNYFNCWEGDITGCTIASNRIGVPMTSARQITARFNTLVISNGTPSEWMTQYGLTNDTMDTDSDGLTNWQEYVTGTNPTNPGSCLVISNLSAAPGTGYVLQWPSESGRFYKVTRSTDLIHSAFVTLTNMPATPPLNVHTDNTAVPFSAYRIRATFP